MKELIRLVRENIWKLEPYSCARDEFKGLNAEVFLDANESPYNAPVNRYPDPRQEAVKAELSKIKGVPTRNIFLGNGSDEAIDLIYRIFCEPGQDNVVAISPSYGMYSVCAHINNIEYREVLLNEDFSMSASKVLEACDELTKVIWLCSPNNPTGNLLKRSEVEKVLREFQGIVVLDEAYIDYASEPSFRYELDKWPNIIVLNTMSKAWASAAIRLGMAFANWDIIKLMNRVKYPYNISLLTQQEALKALAMASTVNDQVKIGLTERGNLMKAVAELPITKQVYPSDANFFLVRVTDATAVYKYLITNGIVVRNRTNVQLCGNCLRITVGSGEENRKLIKALRAYENTVY